MTKFAVVAIGYNRKDCLERLLFSIKKADYFGYEVDLIISLDKSDNKNIEEFAKSFYWQFGDKKVITYAERLGLRKHILSCGKFLEIYDALIVLEDDVFVSPSFFTYSIATYNRYRNDDRIAGISLYNYSWNENVSLPFQAAYSQYDVYFAQMAQSWGQIWLKNQWMDFITWYEKNNEDTIKNINIPKVVLNWPETSWKKYHIAYCIDQNKFFVYPYKSLSTCFSEVGEHCKKKNTLIQTSLLHSVKKEWILPDLSEKDVVKYDAFFERIFNDEKLFIYNSDDICIDLYGSKYFYENKKYVYSTKCLPFEIIHKNGVSFKPQELNLIYDVQGNSVFLYDTNKKIKKTKPQNIIDLFRYRYNVYGKNKLMLLCVLDSIKEKIKGFFKHK